MGYGGAFYDKQDAGPAEQSKDISLQAEANKQPARGCCRPINWRLIACLAGLGLAIVLVAFGITLLVFSTTFHSTDPQVSIDHFDFSGLSLNRTGSLLFDPQDFGIYLSAVINVTTTIGNPNNYQLFIDYLAVDVQYSGLPIATTISPGLPTLNANQNLTTVLPFNINNVPLLDLNGQQSLLSTALNTQRLEFQFTVYSKGHVKVWGFSTPSYLIKLVCDVTIAPLQSEAMTQECTKYHKNA